MKLTAAEETLIELVRGNVGVDFSLSVTWIGPLWTVSLASESDGHLSGSGDTFRQAFRAAFGFTDGPEVQARASRPLLRLVATTDGQGSK